MSANKLRYYEVTLTSMVRANNQSEALGLVFGEDFQGEIIWQESDASRVTATEANSVTA